MIPCLFDKGIMLLSLEVKKGFIYKVEVGSYHLWRKG